MNEMSDITEKYKETWKSLEGMYSDLRSDKEISDKDYANKLTDTLKPILFEFTKEAADNNGKFKIGRGIIQINSLKTNTRIRIPVNGENIDKGVWKSQQKKWVKEFFDSYVDTNDKSLMYLQPDESHHLLTELMWRFQSEEKEKLAIVVQGFQDNLDNNIIKSIKKSQNESEFSCIEINTGLKFDDIKKELTRTLNSLLPNNSKIPLLKEKYEETDCENLLKNPYKILSGEIDPYKDKPNNIFYISDIIETDYLGSFDFELIYDYKNNIDITELCSFIKKVRWLLSKFVIEQVATAEKNFVSAGEIYRDVYFWKDDKTTKYKGLENFIECLNRPDINKKSEIYKVYNKVRNHFHVAKTKNGDYWRGYKRHAYEVACTVAGIIDILFPIKDMELENTVRSHGVGLEGLSSKLDKKKIPYIFRQLFRGLEREKELFLLPKYRDHFIHSFYCFSFGLILLNKRSFIPTIIPNTLDISILLIKKWFITAMWHDIAYTLEKGNEIIEKYVLNFMDNPKRYKNVFPWVPRLGNLMQIDNLLDELKSLSDNNTITFNKNIFLKKSKKIYVKDIVLAVAFDHVNHGIWSSLFTYHVLRNPYKKIFSKEENPKKSIKDICKAILPHHLSDWKVNDIFKDFDLREDIKEWLDKLDIAKTGDWSDIAKIDADNNSLGYLLSLCDIFCQAGREDPYYTEDRKKASDIQIQFSDMEIDRNKLAITISYKNGMTKDKLKKTIDDHYTKPLKYLGIMSLEKSTEIGTIKINLISKTKTEDGDYKKIE
jgi:hypothetical protein